MREVGADFSVLSSVCFRRVSGVGRNASDFKFMIFMAHRFLHSRNVFGLFGGNPSKDQFANLLLKEAKRAGIAAVFEYDPGEFVLKQHGGLLFLGNIYASYCQANAGHKKRLLGNFLETLRISSRPEAFEEAKNNLVTVIREKALFIFTDLAQRIAGNGKGIHVAAEPITAWFCKTLVIDFPGAISSVGEDDLKKWNVGFEEAAEAGVQYLRNCTTPRFVPENGYFVGVWNDDYDSSRLLLAELFGHLPLEGDPVIVIPNRLTLMVTGSGQPDAIKAMLAKAENIVQTIARPQNPAPLVIRNGEIADFTVGKSSPVFNEVRRAFCLAALIYYQQQKELLDKLHEKNGKDLFVAKYTLNQLKDGSYQSCAVWSKGVIALLPRTDVIMLYDPEKPEKERSLGFVAWDKLVSLAGSLMLDAEMFPERYYVSKFPDEDQLKNLLD